MGNAVSSHCYLGFRWEKEMIWMGGLTSVNTHPHLPVFGHQQQVEGDVLLMVDDEHTFGEIFVGDMEKLTT